tara:strand:- start:719 stop:853 length:135 start_codon:yes stop_codon:yes gene_type:complete
MKKYRDHDSNFNSIVIYLKEAKVILALLLEDLSTGKIEKQIWLK